MYHKATAPRQPQTNRNVPQTLGLEHPPPSALIPAQSALDAKHQHLSARNKSAVPLKSADSAKKTQTNRLRRNPKPRQSARIFDTSQLTVGALGGRGNKPCRFRKKILIGRSCPQAIHIVFQSA
ncbi:unnamed protein product, partial [Iphiclides podalirius]